MRGLLYSSISASAVQAIIGPPGDLLPTTAVLRIDPANNTLMYSGTTNNFVGNHITTNGSPVGLVLDTYSTRTLGTPYSVDFGNAAKWRLMQNSELLDGKVIFNTSGTTYATAWYGGYGEVIPGLSGSYGVFQVTVDVTVNSGTLYTGIGPMDSHTELLPITTSGIYTFYGIIGGAAGPIIEFSNTGSMTGPQNGALNAVVNSCTYAQVSGSHFFAGWANARPTYRTGYSTSWIQFSLGQHLVCGNVAYLGGTKFMASLAVRVGEHQFDSANQDILYAWSDSGPNGDNSIYVKLGHSYTGFNDAYLSYVNTYQNEGAYHYIEQDTKRAGQSFPRGQDDVITWVADTYNTTAASAYGPLRIDGNLVEVSEYNYGDPLPFPSWVRWPVEGLNNTTKEHGVLTFGSNSASSGWAGRLYGATIYMAGPDTNFDNTLVTNAEAWLTAKLPVIDPAAIEIQANSISLYHLGTPPESTASVTNASIYVVGKPASAMALASNIALYTILI